MEDPFHIMKHPFESKENPQTYVENVFSYVHKQPARHILGLVGGNEVSVPAGNLVDVESDLFGRTRDLTNDPSKKYQAPQNGKREIVFTDRSTGRTVTVSTQQQHLPTIQLFSYPGIPAPEPLVKDVYGAPWRF